MASIDLSTLCPEVVYATKPNIKAPVGYNVAGAVIVANARLADAAAQPDPNKTAMTVTVSAGSFQVANQ